MAELHPIVVHLPLTLLMLWPVIDAFGLLLKRTDVSNVALALLLLGLLGSLIATATGQAAFDAALAKGADPKVLNTHADNANLVPWALLALVAVRWVAVNKLKRKGHVAAIVLGLSMWPLVITVGHTGGKLVFDHAIGVRAPR